MHDTYWGARVKGVQAGCAHKSCAQVELVQKAFIRAASFSSTFNYTWTLNHYEGIQPFDKFLGEMARWVRAGPGCESSLV